MEAEHPKKPSLAEQKIPRISPYYATGYCGLSHRPSQLAYIDESTCVYSVGGLLASYSMKASLTSDPSSTAMKFSAALASVQAVLAIVPSRNLKMLAVCEQVDGHAQICLLDAATFKRTKVIMSQSDCDFISCDFSHDGQTLAAITSDPDNRLTCWSLEKTKVQGQISLGSPSIRVTINPKDDKLMATSGPNSFHIFQLREGVFRDIPIVGLHKLHDAAPGTPTSPNPSGGGGSAATLHVHDHSWLPNGSCAVATPNGVIHIITNGHVSQRLLAEKPVLSLTVTPSSHGLLVGHPDAELTLYSWNLERKAFSVQDRLKVPGVGKADAYQVAVSPGETSVLVAPEPCDNLVVYYLKQADWHTGELNTFYPLLQGFHVGSIVALAVCTRRGLLATCGADQTIRVWDYINAHCETVYHCTDGDQPLCAAFHGMGYQLMVGFTHRLTVYNVLVNSLLVARELPIKKSSCIQYAHGSHLVAAAAGRDIYIMSSLSWRTLAVLKGHPRIVTSLAWSFDDHYLASAGIEGTIYGWNMETFKRVEENIIKGSQYSGIHYGHNTAQLYTVGPTNPLRILDTFRDQMASSFPRGGAVADGFGAKGMRGDSATRKATGELFRMSLSYEHGTEERVAKGDLRQKLREMNARIRKQKDQEGALAAAGDNAASAGLDQTHSQQSLAGLLSADAGDRLDRSILGSDADEVTVTHRPTTLSLCWQRDLLATGARNGAVRLHRLPITQDHAEFREYFMHNAEVVAACLTDCGNFMFSAAANGVLFMLRVEDYDLSSHKGVRQIDFPDSDNSLVMIQKETLAAQTAEVKELRQRLEKMSLEHEYKLHRVEQDWIQKTKLMEEENQQRMDKLKKSMEDLARQNNFQTIQFDQNLADEAHRRQVEVQAMEDEVESKLVREIARAEGWKKEVERLKKKFGRELARIQEDKDGEVAELKARHEAAEAALNFKLQQLREDFHLEKQTNAANLDTELMIHDEELRTALEDARSQLVLEKERTIEARSQRRYFRNLHEASTEQLRESEAKVATLEKEMAALAVTNKNLEKRIADEAANQKQREKLMFDKDKRLQQMQKQLEEEEAFSRVRDMKIGLLQEEQAPIIARSIDQRERIVVLEKWQAENLAKEHKASDRIKALTLKLQIRDQDVQKAEMKAYDATRKLSLFATELSRLVQEAHPDAWKPGILAIYQKFRDATSSEDVDTGNNEEGVRQRLGLEQYIAVLKKSVAKRELKVRREESKKLGENMVMIQMYNEQQRELKELMQLMQVVQGELYSIRERQRRGKTDDTRWQAQGDAADVGAMQEADGSNYRWPRSASRGRDNAGSPELGLQASLSMPSLHADASTRSRVSPRDLTGELGASPAENMFRHSSRDDASSPYAQGAGDGSGRVGIPRPGTSLGGVGSRSFTGSMTPDYPVSGGVRRSVHPAAVSSLHAGGGAGASSPLTTPQHVYSSGPLGTLQALVGTRGQVEGQRREIEALTQTVTQISSHSALGRGRGTVERIASGKFGANARFGINRAHADGKTPSTGAGQPDKSGGGLSRGGTGGTAADVNRGLSNRGSELQGRPGQEHSAADSKQGGYDAVNVTVPAVRVQSGHDEGSGNKQLSNNHLGQWTYEDEAELEAETQSLMVQRHSLK